MPIQKNINREFFHAWTHEMAYVLGFMFADGSLNVNPRGSHYFSFHIADRALLYAIQRVMGSEHHVAERTRGEGERNHYRLQIGNAHMCKQLRVLGVQERKAHCMTLPAVPVAYVSDFVRGYFDGDGNVWVGQVHKDRKTETTVIHTTFSSCSKAFLENLRDCLHGQGLGFGSLLLSRKAYRLQYSVNDSILLYRLMYRAVSGKLELPRKRKVFERYITMRT